jgi:glycosyltransferase involved in cell wall biosynthesis
MSGVEISVVIPVYNSAPILPALQARLQAALADISNSFEIIYVDDGSQDASWVVLRQLREHDRQHVVAIQLMRNYGQHNALMCGLRAAHGQYIVTMDDDLQHPPEEIVKLFTAIAHSELDLVYGAYDRKKHSIIRNAASWVVTRFYRLVFKSPVTITSFRILRRELLETILSYSLNFTFLDGLFAWNTHRIADVKVSHQPRAKGRSGYQFGKLVALAVNLFTSFSLLPLRLASWCGVSAALTGLIASMYYVVLYVTSNIAVPGFALTIVSVLILGGLQLLGIGILGEYVGRLHLSVIRKPQYSVRQILASDDPRDGGLRAKFGKGEREADSRAA